MIKELADLLKNYPGEAGHTRCFTHIINLVAKSIIRQFDILKGKVDKALDDAEWELCELAEGINLEDLRMQGEREDDDDDLDENNDGWIDEWEALDVADCEELDAAVHPVKLVLVKVSVDVFKSMLLLTWHWQLHTQFCTPQQFSYHCGFKHLSNWNWQHARCPAMCPPDGIQLSTCLSLQLSIEWQSMTSVAVRMLAFTSMNWVRKNGVLHSSCATHWRFILLSKFGIPFILTSHNLKIFKDATLFFFTFHSKPGNCYSGNGSYWWDIEHNFTQQILLSVDLCCTWDHKENPKPLLQCNR